jgi:hypothetical protein
MMTSLWNCLTNVSKAGVAVAASPVALVADLVTLPASACDNKPAFGRTGKMLNAAGACITKAVEPTDTEGN